MAPAHYPISIYRGDDWGLTVTLTDAAGVPIDLTGWAVQAQIRRTFDDTTPMATVTVTIEVAVAGIMSLSLTPAQTSVLANGGVWDLQTTEPDGGRVRTVLAGPVIVAKDVTR